MVSYNGYCSEEKSSLRPLPLLLKLTQHRVAWLEQLVLRIKGIPHVVLNSPYSFCEATGPLPFVQGFDQNLKYSFLVGRTHSISSTREERNPPVAPSSSPGCSSSDILLYLRLEHNIDLDCDVVMDDDGVGSRLVSKLTMLQCSDRLAYLSLIQEDLHPTFQSIQFCDEISYNTCYLPTARQIMSINKDTTWFHNLISVLYQPLHNLQSYFQRTRALSELQSRKSSYSWRNKILFTKACRQPQVQFLAAMSHLNDIYSVLNDRLKMNCTEPVQDAADLQLRQPFFLLGTSYPTNVDAVLFAHLAEAITDIHVLPILSQYETLMEFFQMIFHTYFGPNYRFPSSSHNEEEEHRECLEELVKRNNASNYQNASGTNVYNSIQVDVASILRANLDRKSLWDAAVAQQQQYDRFYGGGETIHRWLMEGGMFPESDDEKLYGPVFCNGKKQQSQKKDETTMHNSTNSRQDSSYQQQQKMESMMEKLQQERKNDDKLWLSCIAATLVGAILISRQ